MQHVSPLSQQSRNCHWRIQRDWQRDCQSVWYGRLINHQLYGLSLCQRRNLIFSISFYFFFKWRTVPKWCFVQEEVSNVFFFFIIIIFILHITLNSAQIEKMSSPNCFDSYWERYKNCTEKSLCEYKLYVFTLFICIYIEKSPVALRYST